MQPRVAEGGDQVLDEQRRLEVRERNRLGVRERGVQVAELQRLAAVQHPRKPDVHAASPLGTLERFFVHRDAFGQPAGDSLVGHLDRDDVRQLVPQRRFPLELARRARLRRIQRHHAAETGAERADHAGQAHVSHREVVVLRKHLDEDGALRRELVPLSERGRAPGARASTRTPAARAPRPCACAARGRRPSS